MRDEEEVVEPTEKPIGKAVEEPSMEPKEWYCVEHGAVIPKEVKGRMFCPICNKLVSKEPYEKKLEGVGVEVPKPPEVETVEEALAFIKERLAQVYGIGKHDRLILKALEDNPTPLRDGNLLHAFIKSLAPKAYDAHLSTFVIGPLYANFPNLPQAVDKLSTSTVPAVPYVPTVPPVQGVPYAYSYPVSTPHTLPPTWYGNYPQMWSYPPHPQTWYQPKPPKTYKIVVEGQEIETDESGYMAWQRFLKEKEEHELAMKKLEAEIKKITEESGTKNEPTIPVKIGDKEYQVPASLAPLYLKGDDESKKEIEKLREELHKKEIEALQRDLEEVKKRPSFFEELRAFQEIAPMLGFQKGGRTTADLLDSLTERLDQRAAQLLQKIPTPGGEWKPEITRTPEERAKKAEEIKRKLEKSEEILKAEDEFLKAVAELETG